MEGSVALFAAQLAVVVIASKALGRLCERWLKQPSVLGELVAGLIIGPFALGGLSAGPLSIGPFGLPKLGPLFPLAADGTFNEGMIHSFTIMAGVVLMFRAGLETDLAQFVRFAFAGFVVGMGGAVASFALGDAAAVYFGGAKSFTDPMALLMGTVSTATSVGLTVRVLSDKDKLDSPEGATILSAAVIDDVIGLVFLSIVLAATAGGKWRGTGAIPWTVVKDIVLKAVLFWVGFLVLGLVACRHFTRLLKMFGSSEAAAATALAVAMVAAALAEASGMALIVGAYVMGLSLNKSDLRHELHHGLASIYEFLVPILFCVTGMMADLSKIVPVLIYGAGFTALCAVGKIIGCGLPALPLGFNLRGASRIGVAMMPRLEVGLIVAAIAMSRRAIGSDDMGAVVLMVIVTAIVTPLLLSVLFDSRSGYRRRAEEREDETLSIRMAFPGAELAKLVAEQMLKAFQIEQFYVFDLPRVEFSYELRKEEYTAFLRIEKNAVVISAKAKTMRYVKLMVIEELLALEDVFRESAKVGGFERLRKTLIHDSMTDSDVIKPR